MIACAVSGASGRMGRRLVELVVAAPDIELVGAWVGPGSAVLGQAVGAAAPALAYAMVGHTARRADVVVDFSRAEAFDGVLDACLRENLALVTGTTGLSPAQQERLDRASAEIPVLWSANFSPGIAVLAELVATAAAALPHWDAEIVDVHHAGKRDAPSGTALALGAALAQARGQAGVEPVVGRSGGDCARRPEEIGYAAVRAGDAVGEHTVMLATEGERIELVHRATSRAIFARGALHAARWLHGRPPGRYRFVDTLRDAERPSGDA